MPTARRSRRAGFAWRLAWCLGAAAPLAAPVAAQQQQLAATHSAFVVRLTAGDDADLARVPAALRLPITLRLRGVTVERVLQEVMARTDASLTYSRAVVPLDRIVSVDVEDAPALEALRQALGGAGVELWISAEGRMALVPESRAPRTRVPAQLGTITGRVTVAESGEPVPAAMVSVRGTRLGASTGPDGSFTIGSVPPGEQVVRVQRLGFAPDSQTVTVVADQSVAVSFALRPVAVQLAEVVSIGYGTATRRDLTGAVASVSSREIAAAPVQSVDQALLGRAPGVQVMSNSGQPGAGALVRVRGGNSINAGSNPLYVIDGVPVIAAAQGTNTGSLQTQGLSGLNPLAALSPNDIESIEVLKDASATAIYGSRAANGVILITTKRGRTGQPSININTYYGVQQVRNRLDLLDAREFAELANAARANAGETEPLYTPEQIAAMGSGTDWQDQIFQDAPVRNVDIAVSGGDENTRYYLSGNLLRSDGVVIGTNMDRGSVRLNLDQDFSSKFRIGSNVSFSRSEGQVMPNGGNGQEQSSVILNALLAPPTIPVRAEGGEYFIGLNEANGRFFSNPVATALEITNEETQNRLIGNLYGEYDLMAGLRLRSTFGIDYLNSQQDYYSPVTTFPGRNVGGRGSRGQAQTTSWLTETTLNYKRSLGGMHDLDLLGGLTLQRTSSDNISGTAEGFLNDRLRENQLNAANTFVGVWTGAPNSSLVSYFARGNWTVADRYLFTVTGRIDGSSKFGSGNQYGFFPSAAVAWRASEEEFVRRLGVFDDLKLRLSYGRTGNQDIGNFESLARLGSTVYVFNGGRAIGYAPTTLANPDLKWETTDQLDVGLDAAFLDSRIAVTADYYEKKTSDLLLFVPIPATSGFGTSLQNIGSVRNRGVELSLRTVNLTGALGWESELNLAWNRNRVLSLGADDEIVGLGGVGAGANQDPTILRVGEPTSAFYGWRFDRVEDGVVKYRDLNGDGEITGEDRTILGNAQPDYTGGLVNRFTFRNFDLSVFLQWSVGNEIYNINRALLTNTAGNANQLAEVLDADARGVPTPKAGNSFDSNPSDLFVEDGTYLRGKNLRLGYTFPTSLLSRLPMGRVSSVQLYGSVQNFFTVTDYSGFDPEISEYAGTNLQQGFDFGTYPQPRQFTIGLNVGF